MRLVRPLARTTLVAALLQTGMSAPQAQPVFPFADARVERTSHRFPELIQRLERAIEANRMGLVSRVSASAGAAARNITIPGNAVLMVFRNDYAVRMLNANLAAGIEAPIRFYVTENADGTATLSWRPPTAMFAPYRSAELDALARELDPIFIKIAEDAIGR